MRRPHPSRRRSRTCTSSGRSRGGCRRRIDGGRVVVEEEQHLAGDVRPLIVVPLLLGSVDSVTDEYDLRAFDCRRPILIAGGGDPVLNRFERDVFLSRVREREGVGRLGGNPDQGKGLEPGAIRAGRLEAQGLELGHQIGLRESVARGPRSPTRQEIAREEAGMPHDERLRDRRGGGVGAGKSSILRGQRGGPEEEGEELWKRLRQAAHAPRG
ncbi:hypothetical protein BH18GEM1_BH18GEM1_20520 [soil metagenome]